MIFLKLKKNQLSKVKPLKITIIKGNIFCPKFDSQGTNVRHLSHINDILQIIFQTKVFLQLPLVMNRTKLSIEFLSLESKLLLYQ